MASPIHSIHGRGLCVITHGFGFVDLDCTHTHTHLSEDDVKSLQPLRSPTLAGKTIVDFVCHE